jgi:copper homeostasis protein
LIREKGIDLPIRAMVRPRFGDFCYTEDEFQQMLREVRQWKEHGAEGVVFGVLLPDGGLDVARMRLLCHCAEGMRVTLHRAFDMAADPAETLKQAADLGIDTILTSGQRASAAEGAALIAALTANRHGVEILVGGGVSAETIPPLRKQTGASAFHMSGKTTRQSEMRYRNPAVSMGLPAMSEYQRWVTDREKVRAARNVLEEIE